MRFLTRFLDWRRELLFFSISAMEVLWLYPWIAFLLAFISGPQYTLSLASMWACLFGGAVAARVLYQLDLEIRKQQVLFVAIGLLVILLVIKFELYPSYALLGLRWVGQLIHDIRAVPLAVPPQLLIWFAGLFLWWRGLKLAQSGLWWGTVGVHFRLGVVAWMLFLILSAFVQPFASLNLLLAYFYFGLLAIALARAHELGQIRGGMRAPFTSSWLLILLGGATLVLFLGLLTSSLFSLDHTQSALQALRPILELVGNAIRDAVLFVLYLIFILVTQVVMAIRRLLNPQAEEVELELPDFSGLEKLEEQTDWAKYAEALKLSRDVVLIGAVILAILLVFWAVRRQMRRRAADRQMTRESLWSSANLMDDLAAMLKGGLRKLRDGAGNLHLFAERYRLFSIRQIYASLNLLAAERGAPREAAQTPHEYIQTLKSAWPEQTEELGLLTESYVQAHYGQRSDTADALRQAREAWDKLRAAGSP